MTYIGFIGDSYITDHVIEEPPSGANKKMAFFSFDQPYDPYNETSVIDFVYVYSQGLITTYQITESVISFISEKFTIIADDGETYITLFQEDADEFGLVSSENIETVDGTDTVPLLGFSIDHFSLPQYASQMAYLFTQNYINNTSNFSGFAVVINSDETGYTLHNMTELSRTETGDWLGKLDNQNFSASEGNFFTNLQGISSMLQYDSFTGFEDWFKFPSFNYTYLVLIIVIVLIVLIFMAWKAGWFAYPISK